MAAGNAVIALLFAGAGLLLSALHPSAQHWQVVGLPSFFLSPLIGGLAASFVWRRLRPGIGATALNALSMTLLGLGGAAIVFHEGVICLLIVAPLFYVLVLTGALIGRVWFKPDDVRFRFSILPLLALFAIGEPLARSGGGGVVRDELLIRATPERVWPEVTAFPEITTEPAFWLFRLGLPHPVATTSAGDFVGAERRCIFSGGAVFKEKVAGLIPGKELTFDIIESPPDPELIGHLTPTRGQFLLRDNGDGTTTLAGSTWYALHVRPLWYFDWWTRQIFRAVHRRVMEDVRRRAERAPRGSHDEGV
jgi:hypothetical protein